VDGVESGLALVERIKELGFLGFLILVICGLSFIVWKLWDKNEKNHDARLIDALEMKALLGEIKELMEDGQKLDEQRVRTWEAMERGHQSVTESHRDLKQIISENTIELRHLQRHVERGRGS